MRRQREYEQSPWSGRAYKSAPTVDELTKESMDVLKSHPSISKATGIDVMDRFIEQFKAEAGICSVPDCGFYANDDSDFCPKHY